MKQKAVVLDDVKKLSLREIDTPWPEQPGPTDVLIAIQTVGICGSDIHYYQHGRIGDFVLREPMILGHEASGVVQAVGSQVRHLAPGDRVCMEPGIPDFTSAESLRGQYNLDPSVRFWATPPVHGCLVPLIVHPASLTYKLPDHVTMAEGAMVEPLAIGVHAAAKANIRPGDIAVVIGAGTIGVVTALAALASGCAAVIVSDLAAAKLELLKIYPGIIPVDITRENLKDVVVRETAGRGADIVFEASGAAKAFDTLMQLPCPGGRIVLIGMPAEPVRIDVVALEVKEVTVTGIFRYANVWERTINLLASGKVDLKPLISATYPFDRSVEAFDRAVEQRSGDVKVQITL